MIKRILKILLPRKFFLKIEEESRKWYIVCKECGYSISFWDAGGIRFGGSLKKMIFGFCPVCKRYKFFSLIKKF